MVISQKLFFTANLGDISKDDISAILKALKSKLPKIDLSSFAASTDVSGVEQALKSVSKITSQIGALLSSVAGGDVETRSLIAQVVNKVMIKITALLRELKQKIEEMLEKIKAEQNQENLPKDNQERLKSLREELESFFKMLKEWEQAFLATVNSVNALLLQRAELVSQLIVVQKDIKSLKSEIANKQQELTAVETRLMTKIEPGLSRVISDQQPQKVEEVKVAEVVPTKESERSSVLAPTPKPKLSLRYLVESLYNYSQEEKFDAKGVSILLAKEFIKQNRLPSSLLGVVSSEISSAADEIRSIINFGRSVQTLGLKLGDRLQVEQVLLTGIQDIGAKLDQYSVQLQQMGSKLGGEHVQQAQTIVARINEPVSISGKPMTPLISI